MFLVDIPPVVAEVLTPDGVANSSEQPRACLSKTSADVRLGWVNGVHHNGMLCRALANITNAKSSVAGSTATTKSTTLQEASKLSVELPSAAVSADGHLETPEKLAGPSCADQEVLVTKSDDNQLEDRVQKILRAIEGAPEDGICDISRDDDDDDVLQCIWESSPEEGQVPLDLLSTLPDMQAPNFLDLLE